MQVIKVEKTTISVIILFSDKTFNIIRDIVAIKTATNNTLNLFINVILYFPIYKQLFKYGYLCDYILNNYYYHYLKHPLIDRLLVNIKVIPYFLIITYI